MNKIFEQLLRARGLSHGFLTPKYEDLSDPFELFDMEKAVERLLLAQKNQEKVLIYGDYDVDGVTATAIMANILKMLGISDYQTMLPDRFIDGYGMSKRLVERVKKEKINLVLTVDCGSNNPEIISDLKKAGADVVVTDHHELNGEAPEDAVAVVNPKRVEFRKRILARQAEILEKKTVRSGTAKENVVKKDIAGLEDLSGAGVAFMVAKALTDRGAINPGQEKWLLDLAMIGTICDSMTLTRDNRIICKFGMLVLEKTRRPGLKELMRVAGVSRISAEAIGFQIGPRLNAAGRMETAELALKLLLTESKLEAAHIADELNHLNQERRNQQNQAIDEVREQGISEDPVIVASGDWHEGIVGIIAGRLTERYKKPSFVLAKIGDEYKGSGRSFGEFNLALALGECQDILISGGGHAAACGIRLKSEHLSEFKQRINAYYQGLKLRDQERFLRVKEDLRLTDIGELNLDLLEEMRELEPFGSGNPEPVFLLTDMEVQNVLKMGAENQHLRLLISDNKGGMLKAVAFNAPEDWLDLQVGARIRVLVSLLENEWNGLRSIEGRILEIGVE